MRLQQEERELLRILIGQQHVSGAISNDLQLPWPRSLCQADKACTQGSKRLTVGLLVPDSIMTSLCAGSR